MAEEGGGTEAHAGRAAATAGRPGQGGARPEGDPGGKDMAWVRRAGRSVTLTSWY